MSVPEEPQLDHPGTRANTIDGPDTQPVSVLVVQPVFADLVIVTSALSRAGFRVTAANSFGEAKPLLAGSPPDVLITALRLDAFNGLHLVLRGRSRNPDLTALVTSFFIDSGTQKDAEDLGATFVCLPLPDEHLIAAVLQTHFRRGTDAAPIRPPFERRQLDRRMLRPVEGEGFERRTDERRRVLPWIVPPSKPT